jgi:hypothetical protein
MMKFGTFMGAASLALTLVAGSAQADVLFGPASALGGSIPASATASFFAGAGAGNTTFRIEGVNSVDGDGNCCTDVFTLTLNGTDIFSGAWDLGGGGGNVIYFSPAGSTAVAFSGPGVSDGGFVDVFVPLMLIEGLNSLTFAMSGGDQGFADESWNIIDATVNGNAPGSGAVPEPATWALMIGGFGMAGAMIRRRRSLAA